MANKVLFVAAVLLGSVAVAYGAVKYNPISSTTSTPLPISETGIKTFVTGAKNLKSLGPKVTNVHLSRYADPKWDAQFAGSPVFWMGVGHGGCGYGNLLDGNKYPYLMGLALSTGARNALGFKNTEGVGCGGCVRATCNDEYYCPMGATSAVAVVLDVCPDIPGHDSGKQCHELQADMYIKGWEFATGNSSSNPSVILERVECPNPGTNIQTMVMSNAGKYGFLKVNFQNVGGVGTISNASYTCRDKAGGEEHTVYLYNAYGAVFQTTNNSPETVKDCRFNLTLGDGQKLATNWLGELKKGVEEDFPFVQIIDTGVQAKSSSTPTTPTTSTTWSATPTTSTTWTAPATNWTSSSNTTATTWNTTAWGVAGRKLM